MDRCTSGCPPFISCLGCACHVPKVYVPAYPAVEDISVGLWPSFRSAASSYKENYKQLSLEL